MVNQTEKASPNNLEESANILRKVPLGILTFDEEYRINFVNEILFQPWDLL
jgi:c-di-AMP phosphodiesterase-like protein